jgi:hypothetical protein
MVLLHRPRFTSCFGWAEIMGTILWDVALWLSWGTYAHSLLGSRAVQASYWHFRGTYSLHLQGGWLLLAACLAYSSPLKMEAICYFKTSVIFYQTAWHQMPQDGALLSHTLWPPNPTESIVGGECGIVWLNVKFHMTELQLNRLRWKLKKIHSNMIGSELVIGFIAFL